MAAKRTSKGPDKSADRAKPAKKTKSNAEEHDFQAEVSQLLDIVAHSLYSNKEIFLRELISNASDACDKLRYAALTDTDLLADDAELKITLTTDEKSRTLTVADNGIGMSHDELVNDLGTIARSGTAAFLGQMTGDAAKDMNLIGQFGVGFYSVFMVADTVKVTSAKAGTREGWVWESDGKGRFTVRPAPKGTSRGTKIEIKLAKDQGEFTQSTRLQHIVKTYSDHLALPIVLTGEPAGEVGGEDGGEDRQLNAASALWTRAKSDIDEQQYTEFYHHVGHGLDAPWLTLHNKVEGVVAYSSLVFIPSTRPYDLFHPERASRLKLYVRRVFITDDCEELLPSWLRFLRGVIDSEDLPLNVSREMLQNNPVVAKIRTATVKRVLGELKKKADKAPDEYRLFWENFGPVLKEGLYEDPDYRDALTGLARFASTYVGSEGEGQEQTGLAGYVDRMKDGQTEIFYIIGEDAATLAASPQLEAFRARGIEVLLLTDPVDEFWVPTVSEFDGKPFRSATRGDIDLDKIAADAAGEDAKADKGDAVASDISSLIAKLKLSLGDTVKDVRVSNRLTDSPVCLVADEGDMDMHLERMLRQHQRLDSAATRILELNPDHPLIVKMARMVGNTQADRQLDDYASLLLDQARIIEGEAVPDPVAFSQRLAGVMSHGLGEELEEGDATS
ncbi:MAG: molecular chaperone HtpG [Alphaproteobacteria bacterium]|nr:molecular chaperone HtpG [Alphaproteobacteria bacterium]